VFGVYPGYVFNQYQQQKEAGSSSSSSSNCSGGGGDGGISSRNSGSRLATKYGTHLNSRENVREALTVRVVGMNGDMFHIDNIEYCQQHLVDGPWTGYQAPMTRNHWKTIFLG